MKVRSKVLKSVVENGMLVTDNQDIALCIPFAAKEGKVALYSIPNDKTPGLDGFNSFIYKTSWEVVAYDVTADVLDFFSTWKLLKEISNTSLTMVSKVNHLASVADIRPIACCSTLYKVISKMI